MDLSGFIVQILNWLAEASSLFLVAAGLSLIFGVTRIVNFAHGSLYMLGIYVAYSVVQQFGQSPFGFWFSLIAAALLAPQHPGIAAALEAFRKRQTDEVMASDDPRK